MLAWIPDPSPVNYSTSGKLQNLSEPHVDFLCNGDNETTTGMGVERVK